MLSPFVRSQMRSRLAAAEGTVRVKEREIERLSRVLEVSAEHFRY